MVRELFWEVEFSVEWGIIFDWGGGIPGLATESNLSIVNITRPRPHLLCGNFFPFFSFFLPDGVGGGVVSISCFWLVDLSIRFSRGLAYSVRTGFHSLSFFFMSCNDNMQLSEFVVCNFFTMLPSMMLWFLFLTPFLEICVLWCWGFSYQEFRWTIP